MTTIHPQAKQRSILSRPEAFVALRTNRTTFLVRERAGLIPPGAKLNERVFVYDAEHVQQVADAMLAGASEDEIRALVKLQVEERQQRLGRLRTRIAPQLAAAV